MAQQWYIVRDGAQAGPYTIEALTDAFDRGEVGRDTLVWHDGMTDWLPAASVPELGAPAPRPATPPVSRPAPSAVPAPVVVSPASETVAPTKTSRFIKGAGRVRLVLALGALAFWGRSLIAHRGDRAHDKAIGLYNDGIDAERKKQSPTAEQKYSEAIRIDSTFLSPYLNRGVVALNRGDTSRSLADFDAVVRIAHDHTESLRDSLGLESLTKAHQNRGLIYLERADTARALAEFDSAVGRSPHYSSAHYQRGLIRLERGDTASAQSEMAAIAHESTASKEQTASAHLVLGLVAYNRHDFVVAEREFREPGVSAIPQGSRLLGELERRRLKR